jgi:hypothetical protein
MFVITIRFSHKQFLIFTEFNVKQQKSKIMVKKKLKTMIVSLAAAALLTSCYSYTSVVGKGAQGNSEITQWNHYVLYGLAPTGVSDSKKMAGGAENYTVHTRHSFVNGLIGAVTFGIYTPTTTTVTK